MCRRQTPKINQRLEKGWVEPLYLRVIDEIIVDAKPAGHDAAPRPALVPAVMSVGTAAGCASYGRQPCALGRSGLAGRCGRRAVAAAPDAVHAVPTAPGLAFPGSGGRPGGRVANSAECRLASIRAGLPQGRNVRILGAFRPAATPAARLFVRTVLSNYNELLQVQILLPRPTCLLFRSSVASPRKVRYRAGVAPKPWRRKPWRRQTVGDVKR